MSASPQAVAAARDALDARGIELTWDDVAALRGRIEAVLVDRGKFHTRWDGRVEMVVPIADVRGVL